MKSTSVILFLLATEVVSLIGCAGGGGTLAPARHKLLPTTECLRDQAPPHHGLPRELNKTVISDYILEPGDGLLIEPSVFDSPVRVPADQTVLPDGTIDLGDFGRLQVTGRTVSMVEEMIETKIAAAELDLEESQRRVNVRLIDPQSKLIYVLGEVAAPGSYPLVGRETVLDAVVAAGGLSDRASPCDIILSRPTSPGSCRIVMPICYNQIVQLGDSTTNYQLMPGDRIFVASRSLLDCLNPFDHGECDHCCGKQCPCPPGVGFSPPTYYTTPELYPPEFIDEGDIDRKVPAPAAEVGKRTLEASPSRFEDISLLPVLEFAESM